MTAPLFVGMPAIVAGSGLVPPLAWRAVNHELCGTGKHWWAIEGGVRVLGEPKARRTRGKPVTLAKIQRTFGATIDGIASSFGVESVLLAAIVAAESGGKPDAERREPKLRDASIGLCQTLTATAKALEHAAEVELPEKPLPKGGDLAEWRQALRVPETSLRLAAAYVARVRQTLAFELQADPVVLYAAYNAGSVRPSRSTPWGLVYHRTARFDAMDAFVAWYGDACAVWSR